MQDKINNKIGIADPRYKLMIDFKICINKRLYEDNVISFDVYRQMEDYLLKKLNRVINNK